MSAALEKARVAWGDPMPDWIEALAEACAASSQNKVAVRLKRSPAVVSQVLSNSYAAKGGDMASVEDLVRGALMSQSVSCPALGRVPMDECRHYQSKARKGGGYNSRGVQMFRACNRCPRFRKEDA